MSIVYPSGHRIQAYMSSSWTDLTDYVVEDITGKWGILGNGPLDLLADPGTLRITLNNMGQLFTPGHANCLAGWKKGIAVKLEIDYDGVTYTFLWTVKDIEIPLRDDWVDKAYVTLSDWLEYSARDPIVNPGILADQRGDQVIEQVLALMPIQPQATDLDEGVSTFPTAFDTVTSHTKAYSEFSKISLSELGPIYLYKDRVYGETLVFENAHARHGWRSLDNLPLIIAESDLLLKEDGDLLLLETGDAIVLDEVETLTINNETLDLESDYGKQLLNYFTAVANPRKIDASAQVLFRLSEPIPIASGQTVTIKGTYANPSGGLPVNGQDMITPAATTDYLVNTAQNGSGTNITANLVLVSTPYGTEGFTHQVRNGSVYNGWITQYNCRGYGIYYDNPIEHVENDQDSIDEFGTITETLDQKYQSTLAWGALYVAKVVERDKQPRTVLHSITLLANQSPRMLQAFLNFGPGKLIRVQHTKRAIDSYYYIQGVKDFRLAEGGLIVFTWVVKDALSLLLGLSMLAVEFGGTATEDGINFGYLPNVYSDSTPDTLTFSFWMRPDSFATSTQRNVVFGATTDNGGIRFEYHPDTDDNLRLYHNVFNTWPGIWEVNTASVAGNVYHVVATIDLSSTANDPIIYINGSVVAITEIETPVGTPFSKIGTPIVVGNLKSASIDYAWGFDGKVYDARIYHRILSAAEVTELYNSGTPDASLVTDGMKFQAFAVRTGELSDYVNAALSEGMKVLDNMFGAVGTPHGSPTGRSW